MLAVLAISAAILVACGDEAETPVDTNANVNDVIEVKVDILTPEAVEAKEVVKLEVKLTQGDEIVNDADDVKFEVWESGMRDAGQMIDGEFVGDGIFSAETTFDHDGVYYMYAHTNARGMHIMPKQQITVGNPDMSKVVPDEETESMSHSSDDSEDSEE